jgi:hypothetical protein
MMRTLSKPVPLWGLAVVIAGAVAIASIGTALGGGGGTSAEKGASAAGFGPGGFTQRGSYLYGIKSKSVPAGTSQRSVKRKCPRDTQLIAGGGGGFSNEVGEQMTNFEGPFDGPDNNGVPDDGWQVYVDGFNLEGNEGIGAWAICRA